MADDFRVYENSGVRGQLKDLYTSKYQDLFLQFPLNLDSAEQNHWVRFDIKKLKGSPMKADESRSVSFDGAGTSFLDRITTRSAERATALVTTALLAPINIARSTVNEFVNGLPPVLAGLGRELFGGFSGRGKYQGMGAIMMFSPHSRQENMKLNWNTAEIGQAGAQFKASGAKVIPALKSILNRNAETIESIIRNPSLFGNMAGGVLAGGMVGNENFQNLFLKQAGLALNPHLEMFFSGIDFRSFTFEFKMAPRNAPEARAVREIINLFKYSAAPTYVTGPGGWFFTYPNVFDISFFNEDQTHKIARSALTGINVNYTGAGVNSTFYDGHPVETQISLSFTELEIMHKKKIDQGY